jgi:hypothetical protein
MHLNTYIAPANEPGAVLTRYGKPCRRLEAARHRLARLDADLHLQQAEIRAVLPNGTERLLAVLADGRIVTVWDVVPAIANN